MHGQPHFTTVTGRPPVGLAGALARRVGISRVLVLCVWALGMASPGYAAESPPDPSFEVEYKIKAAFLFNFLRFVTWPRQETAGDSPLILGVVDDGPAAGVIAEALRGKTIDNRPLLVIRAPGPSHLGTCHLVFVSRTQSERVREVLGAVAGTPVLVVGEMERFAQQGGTINLVRTNDTIRMEINLEVAERAGLKLSSKLAALATVVRSEL